MTLPSSHYADPLKQLIASESKTCKGCIHLSHVHLIWGIYNCKKAPDVPSEELRKCKLYKDKGE